MLLILLFLVLDIVDSAPVAGATATQASERVDPSSLDPAVIQSALDRHSGRQGPAWNDLGLSSSHVLTRLVKRHGLIVRGRG